MKTPGKQKKAAVKPARVRRIDFADTAATLSTFGGSLLSLESRIMFDGAAVATVSTVTTEQIAQSQADASLSDHDGATADTAPAAPTGEPQHTNGDQALFDALAAYNSATARQEILFVSASVLEYQQLLDGISSNVEVIVLDPARDGVEQMADILANRTGIDAIHLIGDGTEAEMHLGASFLTQESISTRYAEQFQQIGRSLSADADLLIYGCNFGFGEAGQLAIDTLANLTGADVAASTDRTGHVSEYANWQLETTTGSIESLVVISASTQADWDHALATFTVINTSDSGAGSLRTAITSANAAAGADTIVFNIGGVGSVQTIALTSALSTITGQVSIDGWSQGGVGYTGTPLIILDGNNVGGNGLTLSGTADGSLIRGLVIRDFNGFGISIQSGSDNNTIVGNYIGGMTQLGVSAGAGEANSNDGINILGANNIIGGVGAGQRNVISNNAGDGIDMDGVAATGNLIIGNYIGTTAAGTAALGNSSNGIEFGNGASNNTIGGAGAGQGNLISGNTASGIRIDNNTDNITIQGNLIGTNAAGTGNLGNGQFGIDIRGTGSAATSANNIVIGGIAAGQGNTIAFSGNDGIQVTQNAFGVQIIGNSIHSNTGLGIDLGVTGVTANDAGDGDVGANNLQNFPVLTSAQIVSSTQVNLVGSLNSTANSQFRIEFFGNTAQDGTGFGEGQTYLGFVNVTTDGSGNAIFNTTLAASVSAGNFISATATRSNITFTTFTDTSEFAQNRVVPANTAPVLDASKSPALTMINEDAGAPAGAVGTLVLGLVDFAVPAGQVDNVTDPNSGALLGIAITAADTTNGTWFYSTNNGASWNALGAVANANARLLAADANTRLYFQPNPDYNGTLANAITFRAWDQTSGSNGTSADTSTNGGTTAFSAATDTALLTITAVNDAPDIVDATVALNENSANATPVTNVSDSFTLTDFDRDGEAIAYTITAGNTGGAFAIDAVTGAITVANSAALDFETTPSFTLTVQASDGTLSDTAAITVNLTNLNDNAPDIVDATVALNENSANATPVTNVSDSFTLTDFDRDGEAIAYTITAGNTGGAFAIDAVTGAITVANSAALDFETTPSFTLTVQASDGTLSDTAAITVNLTNLNDNAPDIVDATVALNENSANATPVTNVSDSFTLTDFDRDGEAIAYTITAGNTGGAFAIDAVTGAITVANSAALDFETTPSFTLTVQASDGTLSDTAAITVNLTNLNDNAPDIVDATVALNENSANATPVTNVSDSFTLTDFDRDGEAIAYTITAGNTGGAFAIDAVTGAITVANSAALDFETTPSFTLTVQASDGTLSDTAAITVNLLNVNEAPTAGDDTAATTENTAVTTGNVLGNDTDVDSVLSPASITAFDAVSANGGTVVNNGDGTFTYTPAANFNGTDTFTYTVSDGALSDTATVTITVTAANTVTTFFAPPLDWPPGPGSGPAPVPLPRLLGPPPVGIVMPVLPPPELVWSPGGQNSDAVLVADIVDIPDEPAAREAMLSRTFARVEQTNIVPQEPSDLPLEPPSLPVKKVLAVGHNLAERLTKLADNLDGAMQERERQSDLFGRVVTFSGIALSAGFVVWVLRGGSLLASFLVSMPAWRHFDPLPVLGSGKRDRKEHDRKAREEQENGQLRGLDQVLKSSEKPAKQQETDRAKRPKS